MADLFAPLTFTRGPAWLNRFQLAPLTNTQSNPDGTLTSDEINWLSLRAKGGFGLVMTAASHVQRRGQGFPGQLGCFGDEHLDGLKKMAAEIKKYGAVSSVQLHHAGFRSPAELIGETPVAPSVSEDPVARALTTEEVEQLKEDFLKGAERAEEAGFDGVELHGAHGYIICAFLSPTLNQRTDAYGGSLEGRSKLLFDLIDGVRARCRPDFQLGVRISPERFGLQLGEQIEIAKRIMATGKVDYLDLSLWDAFKLPEEEEFKSKALAEWFVDIPRNGCRVGVAGKVYDAETCKKILAMGYDFVVPGRAAVIHHDMPNLIKADGEWKMRAWPVPVAEMEKEGVSPKFVSYLRSWFPGLLEPAESA